VTDRKVEVNEADLRRVLDNTHTPEIKQRLRAALDALGPEPCGHPSASGWYISGGRRLSAFRCVLPKGHHVFDHRRPCCDEDDADDPIHSGDAHLPPADVWAEP